MRKTPDQCPAVCCLWGPASSFPTFVRVHVHTTNGIWLVADGTCWVRRSGLRAGSPCGGFTTLLRVQGEERILAAASSKLSSSSSSSSSKEQAQKVLFWDTVAQKTGIQELKTTRAYLKQVRCAFEPSRLLYRQFGVQKGLFSACFQDGHPESSGRSPMCQVGVFN